MAILYQMFYCGPSVHLNFCLVFEKRKNLDEKGNDGESFH